MKLVRPAVAVGLGVSLVLAGGASAAVKKSPPVCNLITDPKGDAAIAEGVGNDDTLDILSADLASDKNMLTAVVRVTKASPASSMYPYGVTWRVNFSVAGTSLGLAAISDRDGVVGQYSYTDPTTGQGSIIGSDAKVVIDTSKNEIRISVPVSAYGEHAIIKKDVVMGEISALTGAVAQHPEVGNLRFPTVDTTEASDKTYKSGTKSCVTPGK